MSNKFMFYDNFLYAIEQLPKEEQGEACLELCKYGITGELPENKYLAMFCLGIQASVQKYQGRGGVRAGAGAPKGNKNAQKQDDIENNQNNQNNQNFQKQQTETETKNININLKEKNNTKKEKFKKPSLEEIRAYCQERNNDVQAERFYDFYESKGWRVGNQAMKDWMAAVRTWENKNRIENKNHSLDWL